MDLTLSYKLQEDKLIKFTKESLSKKNIKPSELSNNLKLKFEMGLSYQDSVNLLYKIKEEYFGDPELDAVKFKESLRRHSFAFP